MSEPIEIKLNNKEIEKHLLELAKKAENLRPVMKNIAGILAYSTEENFKAEGRPDKRVDLAETTQKERQKKGHWPGQILQVTGQLASSVNTYYDNDCAIIGSNLDYAAIHQLGGNAGKNHAAEIPARPYILLQQEDEKNIIDEITNYLK